MSQRQKQNGGRAIDKTIIFFLSLALALLLLNPVIVHFAIAEVYHNVIAMTLALVSEIIVSKLLKLVKECNIEPLVKRKLRKWFGE